MKYGVASLKEIKIKEQRKFARAIKNVSKENPLEYIMAFQQALTEKNKALASAERRSREITSGAWVEKKDYTFKENYISALKAIRINEEIINEIKNLSASEISSMLPNITQYYVPNEKHKIKNKRNYTVDTQYIDSDTEEQVILDRLQTLISEDRYNELVKRISPEKEGTK